MKDKLKIFIANNVLPIKSKTKNWRDTKLKKSYDEDRVIGRRLIKEQRRTLKRTIYVLIAIMVICLIRLAYFNTSFQQNTIVEFSFIYISLFAILGILFLVFKVSQFQENDLTMLENELKESETNVNDLENEKKILQSKFNNEFELKTRSHFEQIKSKESQYKNQIESLKEAQKKHINQVGDSFIELAQNELENAKNETIERVENQIRSNIFSNTSTKFNESAGVSKAEQLQKERDKKAALKSREEKIEMNEKITNFIQQSLTWKDKMNNEIFETNKRVGELGLRVSEELSQIKQSIYEIKTWAEGNFTQMKFWVKEEVLRIDKNHIQVVNQFEKFNIRYEGDMRGIKQQFDGVNLYIEKVAMTAHERLLAFAQQTQNEFLRLDRRVDASERLLGDMRHNLEKGLLYAKMEREQIRQDSDRKIFTFNNKLDRKLDEFAFKHQISIRDLTHLVEIKDYQVRDLIGKNQNQIKMEITDMKANQKLQINNLDIKYTVQLKDLETVHMKHLYEQDQKILKVVNKIESFHNDISAVGVRMDKLNVQFQEMGVANDQVRQEARNIVTSLNLRMESIDNALKITRETSKLVEGRIQNSVRGDLLKLKEITINQESKAKELASVEGGLNLMYNDYHNQATEKELNLKSIEQNLSNLHREIVLERKNIQVDNRLMDGELVMSEKLAKLEHQKDRIERAYDDVNKEANMYKDMANYYKKKGGKGY